MTEQNKQLTLPKGSFILPNLYVEANDGCIEAQRQLYGAHRCQWNQKGMEASAKNVSELYARIWLTEIIPLGEPNTPERKAAEEKILRLLEEHKETALTTIDEWIKTLYELRQQLEDADIDSMEVYSTNEVTYPN